MTAAAAAAAAAVLGCGGSASALHEPLHRYLRTLWQRPPAVAWVGDGPPFIVGNTLHLPVGRAAPNGIKAWHWYRAAAAHAAAHAAFSKPPFDGRGLPPITRTLLALLEDARVEHLACRELPGLERLWAPLHTATPHDGTGFEALMRRLARSLLDLKHHDPHPWVQKGLRLFWVGTSRQVLALQQPEQLRHAASLLGHDIGQMRLPFNTRGFAPAPDYRDDSRWMWPGEAAPQPAAPPPPRQQPGADAAAAPPTDMPPASSVMPGEPQRYPEWDHLIARLRRDWCAVFEPPPGAAGPLHDPAAAGRTGTAAGAADGNYDSDDSDDSDDSSLTRPLARVMRRPQRAAASPAARDDAGDSLDVDALVRARVAQRRGLPLDARVYRRTGRAGRQGRITLLIDQSASSAAAWGGVAGAVSRLQASRRVAALLLAAVHASAVEVAVYGFSSSGRHAVVVNAVKTFAEATGQQVLSRLSGLHSGHSTRLGAALRHAARGLQAMPGRGTERLLLVVSDGEPYDIDIHDPRYLVADARHAVLQAASRGIRVCCIVLEPGGLATARQIYGARNAGLLTSMPQLTRLAARLGL